MGDDMKLVVVSDNHKNSIILNSVIEKYQNEDVVMIHCGDSEMPSSLLRNFICVRGNNDFDVDFPLFRIVDFADHKIYITHGHKEIIFGSKNHLLQKAKSLGCSLVLYGHTHIFEDLMLEGIRFVNPGSMRYNRDGTRTSYAEIEILGKEITVKRIDC